jgi:hypothetical protein
MEYPDNGAYMVAAYVVTAVIVTGYAASLFYRLRKYVQG